MENNVGDMNWFLLLLLTVDVSADKVRFRVRNSNKRYTTCVSFGEPASFFVCGTRAYHVA